MQQSHSSVKHWNDTFLVEIALKSQCSYSCGLDIRMTGGNIRGLL
ncbi:hypothetical protein [Wolbachia endosymbiont (group A) of Beris morrisii]